MKKIKVKKNKKIKIKKNGQTLFEEKPTKNMIIECSDEIEIEN